MGSCHSKYHFSLLLRPLAWLEELGQTTKGQIMWKDTSSAPSDASWYSPPHPQTLPSLGKHFKWLESWEDF